jgi:HicB-like protein involved in pilus formation
MQMAPFVESVQQDLAALAAVGDPQLAETVHRISAALESSFRLRLLEAVTAAAHELTSQIPTGHVEVRLAGQDPSLVFVEDAPTPGPQVGSEDAFSARITLRLPESLKASVEFAASRDGASVNAWIVQALARSIDPRPQRGPKRLTGFARS